MILESDYYVSVENIDRNGKMELKENLNAMQKFEHYILQKFYTTVEYICNSE